jgi:isoquinoline 1-oxidoreductase alpha subunit
MASGKQVTTIEGLAETALGKTVQEAWQEVDVPQCGYCQSGQIMAATALLKENPQSTESQISADGWHPCRCQATASLGDQKQPEKEVLYETQ